MKFLKERFTIDDWSRLIGILVIMICAAKQQYRIWVLEDIADRQSQVIREATVALGNCNRTNEELMKGLK